MVESPYWGLIWQPISLLDSDLTTVFRWLDGFRVVAETRVLGLHFSCEGISSATWQEVLARVERDVVLASCFRLPLHGKAYVITAVACAKLFFAARIALHPPTIVRRATAAFSKCFLGRKY